MIENRFTLPLDSSEATLARVGGKGASLTRLVNAGFPVPSGFHVTTDAYRHFVAKNGLQSQIEEALLNLNHLSLYRLKRHPKR